MDRLPSTHTTLRARAAGTLLNILLCAAGLAVVQQAAAQDAPPPATPPAAPVVAPVTEPVAAPAPAPESTTPPVAEPVVTATPEAPAPAPTAEVAPSAEEPGIEPPKPLSIGLWAHLGTYLNGPESKLKRVSADGELNLLFSADLIDGFGVAGNLVGGYGNDTIASGVSVMDLHGKIGIDDAFNVWIGRMLVPSDRANFSGVWFEAPWFYPGVHFAGPPVGPRQGPSGRNDGLTVWGQFAGGLFKYYAGAYDLHKTAGTALISGRLNLSLINPEPGYYHSSTYYGGKDLLAIGIGGQYQKDGSPGAMEVDDYSEFNADILFEKNFGEGGVLDLEARSTSSWVRASWSTTRSSCSRAG